MKTLDQVEPRTPISSLPHSITAAGSYYLTANLTGVSGSNGITIEASDVTLDLNGFALIGVPGSLEAVAVPAARHNLAIRNGLVRDWGLDGVNALNADNSILAGLRAYRNGLEASFEDGLRVGQNSVVRDCTAEANGRFGIFADDGSTVTGCAASLNGDNGIVVSDYGVVSDCSAKENGFNGIKANLSSTVRGCSAFDNAWNGVDVGSYSTVRDCATYANDRTGVRANFGCTVIGCAAGSNAVDGIEVSQRCKVTDCSTAFNVGDGIEANRDCSIERNVCVGNGNFGDGAGVHTTNGPNVIDGNFVSGNDRGIDVDFGLRSSLIIRNRASNNGSNYEIVANNKVGVIVAAPNTTTAISGSVGGAGVGTTDPWANFSF
ncbi:MAG: right-handed parallel beta-helix repeat-containing protein [Akkermansiaceae bacterium]|nr:right-handed parallel beta-helix repeat-containing protein [Akkermansiaceae bacterium]